MISKKEAERAVIIIPAHNEEASIGKLLDALTKGNWFESYEIIVSCNGCTDDTASIARDYAGVVCLETSTPSKIHAINEAEKIANGHPRIYVDADILIDINSIIKLIEYLKKTKKASVAVPTAIINLSNSSFFVKKFYHAWLNTRYFKNDGHGCGVYALNKEARQTFNEFPQLISDDGYVRYIFPENSTIRLEDSTSRVNAPRDLNSLLKITTRSKLGNIQLSRTIPKEKIDSKPKKIFIIPTSLASKVVYFGVNLYALIMAHRKVKSLENYKWQRDETSRQSAE